MMLFVKVGSLLVNPEKEIIGEGYNDLARKDGSFSWTSEAEKPEDTKFPYG